MKKRARILTRKCKVWLLYPSMPKQILIYLLFFALPTLPMAGKGKVVIDPNKPIQQQLRAENTQYIIKKATDLQGSTIVMPAGSTLLFHSKGTIFNGTIQGKETILHAPKLKRIRFKGTFANNAIKINEDFDVETDFWNFVKSFHHANITLYRDIALPNPPAKDMTIERFHINGRGHTIKIGSCPILRHTDVDLSNINFDCTKAVEHVIYAIGDKTSLHFTARLCTFVNVPETMSLCSRAYTDALIENCSINGILTTLSRRTKEASSQILIYECNGNIAVRNCQIRNCYGTGIKGIGFKPDERSKVLIEHNTIDNVTNGGIVFAGGEVWNATVRVNHISRTHALGKQFDGEINGGPNSAINMHGFRNALVESNIISDCFNSSCLDFDGSISGSNKTEKGTGLKVRNNKISHSGSAALFVVQDVEFSGNTIRTDGDNESSQAIAVLGSRNLRIKGNTFMLCKGHAQHYYPIYITDTKTVRSGEITITGNDISTDDQHFVFVNSVFTGDCQIDKNNIRKSGRKDGTLTVVNNSKTTVNLPKKSKLVKYR